MGGGGRWGGGGGGGGGGGVFKQKFLCPQALGVRLRI